VKDAFLVVTAEIPCHETWGMSGEQVATDLLRLARHKAQKTVDEVGGRLNTTVMPEVEINRGTHVLTGGDCWLVWSQWRAEVPDGVDLDTGRPE
jgi:hypothetical protein